MLYLLGCLVMLSGIGLSCYGIYEKSEIHDSYYGFGSLRSNDIEDAELLITIGIVLVFLGVFILLVRYTVGAFSKKPRTVSGNTANQSKSSQNAVVHNTLRCDNCGAVLSAGSAFCNKCGAALTAKKPSAVSSCAKCGASLSGDSSFCTKCGTKVEK